MTLQERLRYLRGTLWGDDGKTLDEAMALVDALDDKLTTTHTGTIDTWPTPKLALEALIAWEIAIALDPRISSDARMLVERGEKQAADRIDALERENAALRKDAERWSYARKALTWAPSDDGEVKWVMFLAMPEPDVSETGLTPDSVAQELDAAIDAAMAKR